MCGRAYDPAVILAWPNARIAVMGGNQAADTLLSLRIRDAEKSGRPLSPEQIAEMRDSVREAYQRQTEVRYGAARGWVDAIIAPDQTRHWLGCLLSVVHPDRLSRCGSPKREV
jgi:acetyl-CoA carboxylase carboxyltransferase component